MNVESAIRKCISEVWKYDKIPDNVLAICFHSQRVSDGFELYFYGYDQYYEEHDTWLLHEVYEPENNYFNLGIESSMLNEEELYALHKKEVEMFLTTELNRFNKKVEFFCVRFPIGIPELILKR